MSSPPYNPYERSIFSQPTWTGIAVLYAMLAAAPVFVYAIKNPVAAAVIFATLAAVVAVARRAKALRDCLADCGGFTVGLPGRVELTVARDDHCPTC